MKMDTLSLILSLISIVIAISSFFLAKKEFNHESKKDIFLISIDLLKTFYQDIIPNYEKLKEILQTQKKEFFKINNQLININDEGLIDESKSYLKWLSEETTIYNDYLNLCADILIQLQIFSLSLNLQSETINLNDLEQKIVKKYLIIFERIFPYIIHKNDKETYKECVVLYNKLKKTSHNLLHS